MYIENEPTKSSPISPAIAKKIVSDFKDLYWPMSKDDKLEIDPVLFAQYVAWWCRGGGNPAESHQLVRGWSKLRVRTDGYTPSEDDVEEIKTRGATA